MWEVHTCVNDFDAEDISWMVVHSTTKRSFTCITSEEAYAILAALNGLLHQAECYE